MTITHDPDPDALANVIAVGADIEADIEHPITGAPQVDTFTIGTVDSIEPTYIRVTDTNGRVRYIAGRLIESGAIRRTN